MTEPRLHRRYLLPDQRVWECVCIGRRFCTLVAGRGLRLYAPLRKWAELGAREVST